MQMGCKEIDPTEREDMIVLAKSEEIVKKLSACGAICANLTAAKLPDAFLMRGRNSRAAAPPPPTEPVDGVHPPKDGACSPTRSLPCRTPSTSVCCRLPGGVSSSGLPEM